MSSDLLRWRCCGLGLLVHKARSHTYSKFCLSGGNPHDLVSTFQPEKVGEPQPSLPSERVKRNGHPFN